MSYAVTLCSYILPKIQDGTWKRVLFLPTGALLSQISFNEGQSVPGISHGVILEHVEKQVMGQKKMQQREDLQEGDMKRAERRDKSWNICAHL